MNIANITKTISSLHTSQTTVNRSQACWPLLPYSSKYIKVGNSVTFMFTIAWDDKKVSFRNQSNYFTENCTLYTTYWNSTLWLLLRISESSEVERFMSRQRCLSSTVCVDWYRSCTPWIPLRTLVFVFNSLEVWSSPINPQLIATGYKLVF